jgi:hypothetical protein
MITVARAQQTNATVRVPLEVDEEPQVLHVRKSAFVLTKSIYAERE